MAGSPLGIVLSYLRKKQRFSLRELAEFANTDHSYIYRMEAGQKDSPSEEVINRLIKVLKPDEREKEILHYLSQHPDTNPDLVEYFLENPDIKFEEFASAAGFRFRGNVRPEPKVLIQRIRQVIGEGES